MKAYQVEELLVNLVPCSSSSLLVGYLERKPLAEMTLIFLGEISTPANLISISDRPDAFVAYSSPGFLPPGFLYAIGL